MISDDGTFIASSHFIGCAKYFQDLDEMNGTKKEKLNFFKLQKFTIMYVSKDEKHFTMNLLELWNW